MQSGKLGSPVSLMYSYSCVILLTGKASSPKTGEKRGCSQPEAKNKRFEDV